MLDPLIASPCHAARSPRLRQAAARRACLVRLLAAAAVTGLAATVTGCYVREPGVYPASSTQWDEHYPTTEQGFLEAAQESAAIDLGCERVHVVVTKEPNDVYAASGCGKRTKYAATQSRDDQGLWNLEPELQATDGTFHRDDSNGAGNLDAARASGRHDLTCTEPIAPRAIYEHDRHGARSGVSLLADGCGQRATYKVDAHTLLLVSIVKVDPPGTSPQHAPANR